VILNQGRLLFVLVGCRRRSTYSVLRHPAQNQQNDD